MENLQEYPDFVNQIFEKLDEKVKETLVKNIIYSHVEPSGNHFHISYSLANISNQESRILSFDTVIESVKTYSNNFKLWFDKKL